MAIILDQSGLSAGVAGRARRDLKLSTAVTVASSVAGSTYAWTLEYRPAGSAAVLAAPSSATTTFTPDVYGSYRVKLVIDSTTTYTLIAAVRYNVNGQLSKRGWRIPALNEQPPEDNFEGAVTGWHEAYETILTDIRDSVDFVLNTSLGPGPAFNTGDLYGVHGDYQGHKVRTRGASVVGDGGGGVWHWKIGTAPYTDGGGTIVVPTVNTTPAGYWVREGFDTPGRAGPVNVKWFGAQGTFTPWVGPIPTTPDDTVSFQNMITAWEGFGPMYIPTGIYLLTDTLTFTQRSVFVYGDGPELSVLYSTVTSGGAIHNTVATYGFLRSELKDFSLIRPYALSGGASGILTDGFSWSKLDLVVSGAWQNQMLVNNNIECSDIRLVHMRANVYLPTVWDGVSASTACPDPINGLNSQGYANISRINGHWQGLTGTAVYLRAGNQAFNNSDISGSFQACGEAIRVHTGSYQNIHDVHCEFNGINPDVNGHMQSVHGNTDVTALTYPYTIDGSNDTLRIRSTSAYPSSDAYVTVTLTHTSYANYSALLAGVQTDIRAAGGNLANVSVVIDSLSRYVVIKDDVNPTRSLTIGQSSSGSTFNATFGLDELPNNGDIRLINTLRSRVGPNTSGHVSLVGCSGPHISDHNGQVYANSATQNAVLINGASADEQSIVNKSLSTVAIGASYSFGIALTDSPFVVTDTDNLLMNGEMSRWLAGATYSQVWGFKNRTYVATRCGTGLGDTTRTRNSPYCALVTNLPANDQAFGCDILPANNGLQVGMTGVVSFKAKVSVGSVLYCMVTDISDNSATYGPEIWAAGNGVPVEDGFRLYSMMFTVTSAMVTNGVKFYLTFPNPVQVYLSEMQASIGMAAARTFVRRSRSVDGVVELGVGGLLKTFGTAAPAGADPFIASAWQVGDFVENTAPAVAGSGGSQYIITGWRCVAAGSPGTWVEERTLTGT